MRTFSSLFRKLFLLAILTVLVLWALASGPAVADDSATVLDNLIGEDANGLFDLANEKYVDKQNLEAAIYLATLIGRYRSMQESAEITGAFEETLSATQAVIADWERNWNHARELCGNGCDRTTANQAFVRATVLEFPRDPLPNLFEQNSQGRLFCRGGGDISFALESRQQASTIWVNFEGGAQSGQEDHENVYRLAPGECTLLARALRANEQTWLNLSPLLASLDGYSVFWNAGGNVQNIGPTTVNAGRRLGPPPAVVDALTDSFEMQGENTPATFSVWQTLEHLESADRYAEFAVAVDEGRRFLATRVVDLGPWSRYERIQVAFQSGRRPGSNYTGARDSTIRERDPGDRLGGQAICYADGDDPPGSGQAMATLLRWDLRAIPAGSTVKAATIRLDVVDGSEDTYYLYALNRDWREEEVSWTFYRSGSRWAEAGAGGSADRNQTVLGTIGAPGVGSQTISLNAAGLATLQGWVDRPGSNNGFILLNLEAIDGLDFSCREAPATADRPLLELSYTR